MTCALGIVQSGSVWLAADAATTTETHISDVVCEHKAWTVPGWAFAFAGDWRIGMVLRHELRPRERVTNPARFVTIDLAKSLRKILAPEPETAKADCSLLVGHRGQLWELDVADCCAVRSAFGYAAIGVPEAVIALALTGGEPERRLRRVLTAVARHQGNVRPPFTVVRV